MKAMRIKKAVSKTLKRPAAAKAQLDLDEMAGGDMAQKALDRLELEGAEEEEREVDEDVDPADDEDDASDDDNAAPAKKKPSRADIIKRPSTISGSYEAKGWRNRGKDKFLKRSIKNGEIPEHVQAVIDDSKALLITARVMIIRMHNVACMRFHTDVLDERARRTSRSSSTIASSCTTGTTASSSTTRA